VLCLYVTCYVYTGPDIPIDIVCKLIVTASASQSSRHPHTTNGTAFDAWHNPYQNMLGNKQQQHNSSGHYSRVVSPPRLTASKHNQNRYDAIYSYDSDVDTSCNGTLQLLVAIRWTEPCCDGSRITYYQIQR
jgi:hypothetical protein